MGGTGKTPLAELILGRALQNGWKAAYLSRGYGRKTRGYRLVNVLNDRIEDVGDEALQVANKFPECLIVVCEDRKKGIQELIALGVNCIILDDAFQRRDIERNIDILAIDANRPPWLDSLLPMGRLREGVKSIRRADLVVVNKVLEEDKIRNFQRKFSQKIAFTQIVPQKIIPFFSKESYPILTPAEIKKEHKKVCVIFSGIGNNEQFLLEVSRMGVMVIRSYRFGDHYNYRPSDIRKIVRRFKRLLDQNYSVETPIIITTEKDYFRLISQDWFKRDFGEYPFYYLTITLEIIRGRDVFDSELNKLLNRVPIS